MVQRSSTTAFAKSTRPEIGSVVQREALYSRLDGTSARTVVWVSAPPGFGKTTLVASYLEARNYRWAWYQVDADDDDGETFFHYVAHAVRKLRPEGEGLPVFGAEHRADLAGFARRFFRALFANAGGPTALVLDNLHELSAESPLRAILEAGLPQVPQQCCVMVTSRASPPVGLSRLQPGGQMVCLAADDLRITSAELAEIARLRGKPLAAESLQQLNQHAGGWAAALVTYGVLGQGVPGAALRPVPVVGGHVFASLAVGGLFNCGLASDGAAWCWGFASSLGDGSGAQHRDVPTAVVGGHVFVSLTAGYQHACGLQSDGTAWCWGPAVLLGGGTDQNSVVPVAVAGGQKFRVLRAGGVATCGITLAGLPLCWGGNALGAVGQANVS